MSDPAPDECSCVFALNMALEHVKGRGVAADVGSNIGLWTCRMAGVFEVVHAFEPQKDLWPHVQNLTNVRTHSVALWNRRAMGSLRGGDRPRSVHVVEDEKGGVNLAPLDSYRLSRLDLIKIDVEGAEYLVLHGAEGTIKRTRPVVVVENDQKKAQKRYGAKPGEAYGLLTEWGMRLVDQWRRDQIWVWAQ